MLLSTCLLSFASPLRNHRSMAKLWTGLDHRFMTRIYVPCHKICDWTGLVYRHTFYPTAHRPSVSASHTDRNEVWKEAIAHKEGEARNIQMTKSLLRASCLTLEIKKFRCYDAKKFMIILLYVQIWPFSVSILLGLY